MMNTHDELYFEGSIRSFFPCGKKKGIRQRKSQEQRHKSKKTKGRKERNKTKQNKKRVLYYKSEYVRPRVK